MTYFPSLRAFQDAHRVLLQRYRSEGKITAELQNEIEQLLNSGSETGRVLDTLADQKAAQGLLDYWSSCLYRENAVPDREDADKSGPELAHFDPTAEPELADEKCPYVGLRKVEEGETNVFFGREYLVRDMLDRLRDGNFLAVIGSLGSGRSSLVYAGLLPALAYGQLPGSEKWPVKQVTPPLSGHLAAIDHDPSSVIVPTSVVVIDNCDDLFALGSEQEQATFAADVLALADRPGVRRIVVLILHSEYDHLLARVPKLAARIKSANVQVTSPTAKDLRDAIERPAQLVGLKFDDDVVDSIVHDVVGERAAFTLLQFTMKRLWERRTHNRVTFKALQEVGAGRTAVVRAAQAFYQGLSPGQQELLRPILVRLGSAPGPAASTWRTLVEASADPGGADDLLKVLQQAGLIVVSRREVADSAVDERVVRPVHDALKDWDVLAEWIKQEKKNIEFLRRLEGKAHEWVRFGRKNEGLLRELEYLEAEQWLSSPEGSRSGASDDVRKFMEASKRRNLREVRFLRLVAAGFAIGGLITAVVSVFALLWWWEAALQRDLAVLQGELRRVGYIDAQMGKLQKDADLKQAFLSQLKRSEVKAQKENTARARELRNQIAGVESSKASLQEQFSVLARDQNGTIAKITADNTKRWNSESGGRRAQIIAKVLQTVTGDKELSPQSKLRIALFAVAAIPESEPGLNAALRSAILDYRLRNRFSPPGSQQVWAVAFNPRNEHQAAVGDELGVVWLWDPLEDSRAAHRELSAAGDIVNGLAYSGDGRFLAAAYRTSGAVVWQLPAGNEFCPLDRRVPPPASRQLGADPIVGGTYGVAFAPDGRTLAVASGRSARLWDLTQPGCPSLPQDFEHSDEVFGVAFSPDGKLLATASGDGTVAVWRLDRPAEPARRFPTFRPSAGNPMYAVSFSPTGKALAAFSGANGRGYIWDIETGKQIELETRGGTMGQVAFSADGALVVATASANGAAFVSKASTGTLWRELGGGGQNPMFGAAFSPDSQFLLTSNFDGVARLWAIDKYEVTANDREALIAFGAQRFTSISLTQDECNKLRAMDIPIFAFADLGYEREQSFICPLPFLGARPDRTD
jgi:WD40 repeat protein